jgi:FlaA1/EpsC-like NDP-sugar epimerase
MNQRSAKGLMKHLDFIVIDILCLQLCFVLVYWLLRGPGNPYFGPNTQYQIIVLTMSQLAVIVFSQNYKNIIKRNGFDEAVAVLQYIGATIVVALVYLFLVHGSSAVSRLQFGFTAVLFLVLDFALRQLNKRRIFREISSTEKQKSIVLITASHLVPEAMEKLNKTDTCEMYLKR